MTVHTRANLLSELARAAEHEALWERILAGEDAAIPHDALLPLPTAELHVKYWRRKRVDALLALYHLDNG